MVVTNLQKIDRNVIDSTKKSVKGLCGLAKRLGYKDPNHQLQNNDGTCVGDFLELLDDNEGACEALVEWLSEYYGLDEDEEDNEI